MSEEMKYLVKLEITNTVNDGKSIEYYIAPTEEDKNKWIEIKKKERHKWNNDTPGAMSIRYYDFCTWGMDSIQNITMSELNQLSFGEFAMLLKLVK